MASAGEPTVEGLNIDGMGDYLAQRNSSRTRVSDGLYTAHYWPGFSTERTRKYRLPVVVE